MVKENQKVFNTLLVAADIGCAFVSTVLSWHMWTPLSVDAGGYFTLWGYMSFTGILLSGYPVAFYFAGLYASKRYKRFENELAAIACATGVILISLLIYIYLSGLPGYFYSFAWGLASCFILLDGAVRYALRVLLRSLRKKGYNLKYLLLIGSGGLALQFARKVAENPGYGYRFGGCLTDSDNAPGQLLGIDVLGPVSCVGQYVSNSGIDEVIIALELEEYGKIPQIISQCEKNGVKANIIPAYFRHIPSNPRMDEFDGMPVLVLRRIPLTNHFNAALKRIFDIAVALICIILFSPVLLASWAVIRCTTGESAVYKQERAGYALRPFTMYKLRTMLPGDGNAPGWTQKRDRRRTRFGAFIRKFSIDELPQFFNVLAGSMSIVGPRPEIARFAEQFKEHIPRYMVRHQVKPGITGWAQIHNLRGDTSIEDRINSDIYYIENWSLALDIQIIARTVLYAFYNPNE